MEIFEYHLPIVYMAHREIQNSYNRRMHIIGIPRRNALSFVAAFVVCMEYFHIHETISSSSSNIHTISKNLKLKFSKGERWKSDANKPRIMWAKERKNRSRYELSSVIIVSFAHSQLEAWERRYNNRTEFSLFFVEQKGPSVRSVPKK